MSLLIFTLRSIAGAIVTPPLVFLLISLMIILYYKNRKVVTMQKIILGGSVNSIIELTLSQLVLGIIGGCIGSLIITSIGIIFKDNSGISYLFIVSIILAFIKPRLICFSYSGAILGAASVVVKTISMYMPQFKNDIGLDVDIFYLVLLIGIFHIVEGILVIIDGDRGAIPVFTNRDGKILGGYALNRYWVLPIAIMFAVTMDNSTLDYMTEFIKNPDWWPLIKSPTGLKLLSSSIISMFPFYTILGYSAVTFTRNKREKAISSGLSILVYGIVLMVVAQIANAGVIGEIISLIVMAFGHEFMLRLQIKDEEKRNPKFVSDEEGLVVLEISADSKIKEFGIDIESKVISINDKGISSETEIYSILKENFYNAILKIKDSQGKIRDVNFRHIKNTRLGVLLVPRNVDKKDIVPIEESSFKSVLNSMKNTSKSNNTKTDDDNNKEDKF